MTVKLCIVAILATRPDLAQPALSRIVGVLTEGVFVKSPPIRHHLACEVSETSEGGSAGGMSNEACHSGYEPLATGIRDMQASRFPAWRWHNGTS